MLIFIAKLLLVWDLLRLWFRECGRLLPDWSNMFGRNRCCTIDLGTE